MLSLASLLNMPNGNTIIRLNKDTLEPIINRYIKQMENAYYFDDEIVMHEYYWKIRHALHDVLQDRNYYFNVIKSNSLLRGLYFVSK